MQMLIDEQRHPVIGGELAKDPAHRALTVDHGIAGARPDAFQHLVEPQVVERTRKDGDRSIDQRFGNRVDLPVAKMPGEKQHAAVLRIRLTGTLFPLHVYGFPHLLGGIVRKLQQLEEQTSKMREHRACERPAFALPLGREGGGEILERRSPAGAVETITDPSESSTDASNDSHWQHRHDCGHQPHRSEFERPYHPPSLLRSFGETASLSLLRNLPISHRSNSAAGSTSTVIGSTAHSRLQRTASFSVVTMTVVFASRAAA